MEEYKTLITAQEVVKYTPNNVAFDPGQIKSMILLKEEQLFVVWLGIDWHQALLDDLEDHSGFQYFNEGNTYSTGTVVLWRDQLYEVTATPDSAGAMPTNTTKFAEAKKFTKDENNTLWRRYLRTVLAWHIMHTSMVYTAIRQTNAGVVQAGKTGKLGTQEPVQDKALAAFKREIGEDFNSFLMTMDAYLRKNSATYPLYKANQEAESCAANSSKNVGSRFNNFGFSF